MKNTPDGLQGLFSVGRLIRDGIIAVAHASVIDSGEPQLRALRDSLEVAILREHPEIVPDAKLRQQGVDRADLETVAAALFEELRCQIQVRCHVHTSTQIVAQCGERGNLRQGGSRCRKSTLLRGPGEGTSAPGR